MDGAEQHDVRELPPNAAHGSRLRNPHHLIGWLHRGLLPRGMGSMGVPSDHVVPHRGIDGTNHLRVRGDEPRWGG